jgi:hypothetical protein
MQKPAEKRYQNPRSEYWRKYYEAHKVDIKLREYNKLINGDKNVTRVSNRIS